MIILAQRGRPKGSKNKKTKEAVERTSAILQREILDKYTFNDFKKAFGIKSTMDREQLTDLMETPYHCCSCGKKFAVQRGNFMPSQSYLFTHNNMFAPVCYNCVEKEYEDYYTSLGSYTKAFERVCLHWDIYWEEELFKNCVVSKGKTGVGLIKEYVRRTYTAQKRGKTFDTYLDSLNGTKITNISEMEEFNNNEDDDCLSEDTIRFFGLGYSKEEYNFLQSEYDDWANRYECQTKAQEELFKNLSLTQLKIQQATNQGTDIGKLMETFNKLLDNANISPKRTDDNLTKDSQCLGSLIKKWEENQPIPEPNPEWKDVDGIVKYVTVYFLGHLCKMIGIKNTYSKLYDEEMQKYRVERPEYEDDDEALFDSVFYNNEVDDNG